MSRISTILALEITSAHIDQKTIISAQDVAEIVEKGILEAMTLAHNGLIHMSCKDLLPVDRDGVLDMSVVDMDEVLQTGYKTTNR